MKKSKKSLGKSLPCPGCKSIGGAYKIENDKPVCVYCGAELEL